jgi:hypothetical protein
MLVAVVVNGMLVLAPRHSAGEATTGARPEPAIIAPPEKTAVVLPVSTVKTVLIGLVIFGLLRLLPAAPKSEVQGFDLSYWKYP